MTDYHISKKIENESDQGKMKVDILIASMSSATLYANAPLYFYKYNWKIFDRLRLQSMIYQFTVIGYNKN